MKEQLWLCEECGSIAKGERALVDREEIRQARDDPNLEYGTCIDCSIEMADAEKQ